MTQPWYETGLEEALQKDEYTKGLYIGVLSRDELPSKVKYPACFIINTAPRSHEGEHWLAFYYDEKGHADFFDSYGFPPSMYGFESYIEKTSTS
jgi:hypothetical protein